MTSTNQFVILPSQRLLQYCASSDKLIVHSNTRAEDYATSNNKLALISGKAVKYYNIENGFSCQSEPILESYFLKKIEAVTIDSAEKIVVTDKFGDIYEARSQNSLYLNSNLGIPTFMKHIRNPVSGKQYILLGDDYCKLKVYNYKNMHEITAIWYIPNSVPLDVLPVDGESIVLLVKHEDKYNLKHTYKLYSFNVHDLDCSDFKGSLLFEDQTQTLNNTQYHPCSIVFSQENQQLYFIKLFDHEIQIATFTYNNKIFTLNKQFSHKFAQPIKEGNSIQGIFVTQNNERFLLISYGKYFNIDSQQTSKGEKEIQLKQVILSEPYSINENEHLFKLKID